MKKIIAICLFAISAFSFGASSLPKASADVNVYAEVVGDLKVETSPVNFGVIAKNSNRNLPRTDGTITIKGTEGANVRVSFVSSDRDWDATKGAIFTHLFVAGNNDYGDTTRTLYYYADIEQNGQRLKNNVLVIPPNGQIDLKVTGTLDAGNVIPGEYVGKFTVKVQYE